MTIKARFDGKVLIPEEPLDLEKDQQVTIDVHAQAPTPEGGYITAGELARSEIVGMWADRDDIGDSVEFVNQLRRRIERREI